MARKISLFTSFCLVKIVIILCHGTPSAIAGGYIIPHQTARGLALSNALIAGVDDASATYYNPGALGEIAGNNLMINGVYINAVNSVENSGRKAVNKHDDNFIA
ncbi:MAG: hypothetical protein ACM3SP_14780, partial [Chloroflexota bacterium]